MKLDSAVHELTVGQSRLANNLALAPLAGTSDLYFRRICSRLGAGLVITELVSARGLVYDPQMERNWRYLAIDPAAGSMGIQLFGSEPVDFSEAVQRIMAHPVLGKCCLIDINMGCPVKKVVNSGAGSALMKTPQKAVAIVKACLKSSGKVPVTAKFRSGWDDDSLNAPEFARYLEDAGASGLTVHARTRKQMYGGRADWSVIAEVKQSVKIPVWGNGDVTDPASARRMFQETGVDGLMVGRAAQGNPWIFSQLLTELSGNSKVFTEPGLTERIAVITEHLEGLVGSLGEKTAIREMRSQLVFYLRGAKNARKMRSLVMQAKSSHELLAVLADWQL